MEIGKTSARDRQTTSNILKDESFSWVFLVAKGFDQYRHKKYRFIAI